ncbi:sugar transferase [Paenibacillus sp. BSR1-1]|uniref:sugar transferase n=1 Tax=Paenibacillus sp. BSR1-1 TaxID=3020845 RepID=UPI0025AF19AF|nr:sugar transferase [Paenibacillus sp. BSR1-1]MDN3019273.1 sugar transferase [Paenibacillus sp. BSR1-1]
MKRIFDFILSILIIIIFSPVIILLSILVRLKLGSPILFKQERPGLNGKPFLIYKFRTMTNKKDNNGSLLPEHLRLTGFGSFIRKFSLDELPQLINVIKGEISLVGPRPLRMDYLPLYTPLQARRHEVKPGITGWAQIKGRNSISWEERFELDVWYVDNKSFLLDLKILSMTLLKVIRPQGINHDGHVSMPDFTGTKMRSSYGEKESN